MTRLPVVHEENFVEQFCLQTGRDTFNAITKETSLTLMNLPAASSGELVIKLLVAIIHINNRTVAKFNEK